MKQQQMKMQQKIDKQENQLAHFKESIDDYRH